jgi:hypothetical protein
MSVKERELERSGMRLAVMRIRFEAGASAHRMAVVRL